MSSYLSLQPRSLPIALADMAKDDKHTADHWAAELLTDNQLHEYINIRAARVMRPLPRF